MFEWMKWKRTEQRLLTTIEELVQRNDALETEARMLRSELVEWTGTPNQLGIREIEGKGKMKKYLVEQYDDQEVIEAADDLDACRKALKYYEINVTDITKQGGESDAVSTNKIQK